MGQGKTPAPPVNPEIFRGNLNDEQWERIKGFIRVGGRGRPFADSRTSFNGVLWIMRTGAPWRDLPQQFGKWNSVYRFFRILETRGVILKMFEALTEDCDLQDVSIDSTCCKVHQHAAGTLKKGGSEPTRTKKSP